MIFILGRSAVVLHPATKFYQYNDGNLLVNLTP